MISGFLIVLRYMDRLLLSPGSYRSFPVRRFARLYPLYFRHPRLFVVLGIAVHYGWVPSDYPKRYDFSVLPQKSCSCRLGNDERAVLQLCRLTLSASGSAISRCPSSSWWPGAGAWSASLSCPLPPSPCSRPAPRSGSSVRQLARSQHLGAPIAPLLDFTLGGLMALLVPNVRWTLRSPVYAWATFTLAIWRCSTSRNGYLVLALLGLSVTFAAVSGQNNPEGSGLLRVIHPVGKVSFGIYLIHPVVEAIFFSALWRQLREPPTCSASTGTGSFAALVTHHACRPL